MPAVHEAPAKRLAIHRISAAFYAVGLTASGFLFLLAQGTAHSFLEACASSCAQLFTAQAPLVLLSDLFLSSLAAMTFLLLMGFSAMGFPLIPAFLLLRGLGFGLVFLSLCFGQVADGIPVYLFFLVPIEAFSTCLLCSFSAYACTISHRLCRYLLSSGGEAPYKEGGARLLMKRYLLYSCLLLAADGVAAAAALAISCFAS